MQYVRMPKAWRVGKDASATLSNQTCQVNHPKRATVELSGGTKQIFQKT